MTADLTALLAAEAGQANFELHHLWIMSWISDCNPDSCRTSHEVTG